MPNERIGPTVPLLHVHSNYSFLPPERTAATSSPENLVKAAKQKGHEAIGLTDTANFYGLGRFFSACEEYELKPLPGVEVQVTLPDHSKAEITVLPRSNTALRDLFALISKLKRDKKQISLDDIVHQSKESFIILRSDQHELRDLIQEDNFFYGVDSPQDSVVRKGRSIETETGKTVLSHEVRMATPTSALAMEFLLQYSPETNQDLPQKPQDSSPRRHLMDYTIKSPLELIALYGGKRDPMKNTLGRTAELAQDIHVSKPVAPPVHAKSVPEGRTAVDEIRRIGKRQLELIGDRKMRERFAHEMEIIEEKDLADGLLIHRENIIFCDQNGIFHVEYGSEVNLETAYLLGITSVHAPDLYSDRAIHRDRKSRPDLDLNLPYSHIGIVANSNFKNYPGIATHLAEVHRIRSAGAIRMAEEKEIPLTPEMLEAVVSEEIPKKTEMHPSGIVFIEGAPQERNGSKVYAQLDAKDAEDHFNAVKVDLLSWYGPERAQRCYDLMEEDGVEPSWLPYDMRPLIRLFEGKTLGVSFAESPFIRTIFRQMAAATTDLNLDRVAHVQTLARHPKALRDRYFKEFTRPTTLFDRYPEIKKIIGRTNNTVIYQDQVMQLGEMLAGFPYGEMEALRKLKRKHTPRGEELTEDSKRLVQKFTDAAVKKGYNQNVVKELSEQISLFDPIGFLEGHALSMAQHNFELSALSEYYPEYFWAAVLKTIGERSDTTYFSQAYLNEMMRQGFKFTFPQRSLLTNAPVINGKRIQLSKRLLGTKMEYLKNYDAFRYQFIAEDSNEDTIKLIKNQLNYFGKSFTHNPIEMFPEEMRYDPEKRDQWIVGQRVQHPRKYKEFLFITIDSGELLPVILPVPVKNKHPELLERDKNGLNFMYIRILRDEQNTSWQITDMRPVPNSS